MPYLRYQGYVFLPSVGCDQPLTAVWGQLDDSLHVDIGDPREGFGNEALASLTTSHVAGLLF